MGRLRKANKNSTKGKGKMWKKGHSSSFNPDFNKHRQAAKKRGFLGHQGGSNLTEAVLAHHNKVTTDSIADDIEDGTSIGGDTALTAFTNCSLTAFSRLMKNWNAKSLLHKEMVAALAAVTDVLKSSGGKETETEYFAALMTALDVVDTDETVTAVVCLLSMVVKRLNEGVLQTKCKEACDIFVKLLIKYMNSDHSALLKNLLTMTYTFLKTQNYRFLSESSSELNVLLEFTVHHKPKVRKLAYNIIRAISNDDRAESKTTKCVPIIANFCIKKLEDSAAKSNARDVSHVLSLIQEVIDNFPTISIKKCCETIFKIMTLSNAIITLCGFKTLKGLFKAEKNSNIPANLNAQIITALYDYQPNIKDSDCLVQWLELMNRALVHLNKLDEKLCLSHLPNFFSVAVKCWQNETEHVMSVVATTLSDLLHCSIKLESKAYQEVACGDPENNPVHKMFHSVEATLCLQYLKGWNHILRVLAAFFQVLGKQSHSVTMKCLQSLADLHEIYPPYLNEIEKTLGSAIRYMGPRIVLQAIPLDIKENQSDFRRCWMLPLLRENVRKTELSFFMKYFMPLAQKIKTQAMNQEKNGEVVQAKLSRVLVNQIWSLLPSFCTDPTDIQQSFGGLAQTLGMILKEDPSLRIIVLSSLRLLIARNLPNGEEEPIAFDRKVKDTHFISKFSKNYLPILFNLYTMHDPKTTDEQKTRLAVYETMKQFLAVPVRYDCDEFYLKTKEKLDSTDLTPFRHHALMDLCKAMLPYIDIKYVEEFFNFCKPLLLDRNHTIQKKAYSVVKDICSLQSDVNNMKAFIIKILPDLFQTLTESKGGMIPATRAIRLTCLKNIVARLEKEQKSDILDLVPEAVLCTKDNSVRSRAAAYDLLVAIGVQLKTFEEPENSKKAITEYVKVLLAGLAGSPHLMSATILSVCRIMYEFKDDLDRDLVKLLIEDMCILVSSKSREVVETVLSFFKILFATISTMDLAQHVEFMVQCICSICQDNQRHFRFKAKEVFTRLIRKFGFDMISKMVPEKYQKQLTNIRKKESRKQRLKDQKYEMGYDQKSSNKRGNNFDDILADSDEDDIDMDDGESGGPFQKPQRKKSRAPRIEENPEEDIVDFLDPTVNRRLLTTKQDGESKSKRDANSFPVAEDGRLIIQEDEDEKKMKKVREEKSALLAELGAFKKKGNKRKLGDSDSEDERAPKPTAEVATGIHRSVSQKAKKMRPGEEFKSKKAGGDLKKGKMDPYAYLPFNRQVLNKRKKMKLKGQYQSIVKAAQRGANAGLKRKAREAMRKRSK